MAIYYDRKRGTYYVSVYVEYRNGERKRVLRRGFKTKREAKKAESEIVLNAEVSNPENPLFTDIVDQYIDWYEPRRKVSSVHRLKKETRLYIKPFFKGKKIKNIHNSDIMDFHTFLLNNLSVRTSKNVHGFLSAIFNHAVKLGHISVNPAKETGNIQASYDKQFNYWTLEEFKDFLQYVDNFKYRTLYMVLFYSGMRIGELSALTWKDIDFENNIINIDKTNYKGKTTTPKTSSSIRKNKMPYHTMNMLRQYKLQVNSEINHYVFGEYGIPLPLTTIAHNYNAIFKKHDIKRIRIHDFRHSHASYLINKGYDIQIVSKRLGHSKVSVTLDTYAHLYPNKEDEAIEAMEDDFKPAEVINLTK